MDFSFNRKILTQHLTRFSTFLIPFNSEQSGNDFSDNRFKFFFSSLSIMESQEQENHQKLAEFINILIIEMFPLTLKITNLI